MIKLWEGDIQSPITDNRFIGVLKILGSNIMSGVVPTGADIECEYEMTDSGTIILEASIPCIGATFSNRNFYSRQEGQLDLSDIDGLAEQGRQVVERIQNMSAKIHDPRLETARNKANMAAAEDVQKANNELLEAKRLINITRRDNLREIRQMDLDSCVNFFNTTVRKYATPAETQSYDNLVQTAQHSIDRNDADYENILDSLKTKNTIILLRQDWFVIDWYRRISSISSNYLDQAKYLELKRIGDQALISGNIDQLRRTLIELLSIRINSGTGTEMFDIANIVKG